MALEFGRTSHGLDVFVDPMPGMQTARIALDVNVGSMHEQPGEEGLAHVLEHAVHLRSPQFPDKASLTRYRGMNAIGANAYTNFTHTEYHGTGPDVEPIVASLGEIITRPQFVPEDIDPEMEVVTEEVRQRLNHYGLLHSISAAHTLVGGPYGRDIAGHLKHLRYDTDDVRDFYGKYYAYGNMQLWGVGNVSIGQLVEYAEEHFSPLPVPDGRPQKSQVGSGIVNDVRSAYILEKSETNYYTQAVLCDPSLKEEMKAAPYAFQAAATVLSNHAINVLRNREGIAYSAHVYPYWYGDSDCWRLQAYTTAAKENLEKVEEGMAEILSRSAESYTDKDIMAGIGSSRGEILSTMDSIGKRANLQRDHLDWYGEPREISDLADTVRGLDPDAVRRAMDSMLREFGQKPKLTHVTGTAEAVKGADIFIEQDDIM